MKRNKRILKREEQGITLIALVITIIVLLILAGVSIAMLTGENGILTQAQRAKEETENATRQEEEDLAKIEAIITGQEVPITKVDDDNPGELEQENDTTFVINSIEDLVFFSYDVTTNGNTYQGKTVKLGTNLDFNSDKSYVEPNRTDFGTYGYNGPLKELLTSGTGFIPIGEQAVDGTNYFYGTFEGNNKAICSLYININSEENINAGLFSTSYGEIRNLGLINVNINAEGALATTVGGLIGTSYKNIDNSYVSGNIKVSGSSWVTAGGICARVYNSNIENCYNLASIECKNLREEFNNNAADIGCGGIVGIGHGEVNINKCFNKGSILANGGNNYIAEGGICGHINSGSIKNSYNTAELEGISGLFESDVYSTIGGIVGSSEADLIEYCYNLGTIIEKSKMHSITGGIVAHQSETATISNVFNIGKIEIEESNIHSTGGILGFRGGIFAVNIENAYNIGKIDIEELSTIDIGAITGTSDVKVITFNNCFYLTGTYDSGVGNGGTATGITELDSIDKFPSVLEVVNGEGAFEEDTNNVNRGYPVLKIDS